MLNENEKKQLIEALMAKIKGRYVCPICHNSSFTIVDGYLTQSIQEDYHGIVLGNGPMLPSIAVVCNNCGFTSMHNLGVLGLLNENENHEK